MVSRAHRGGSTQERLPKTRPATPAVEQQVMAQVWPLAEALCDSAGLELVHLEYRRERGGRMMRVYIDKPGGVTLDDCAAVSNELGDVLDVHLPGLGPYHLEISSPGLNRPLSREKDFERFRGRRARITTRSPIEGQKNFSGVLEGLVDGAVRLCKDGRTISIPLDDILKAHVVESNAP